jgi:hypothetical protein
VHGPIGSYIKVFPGKEDFQDLAELALGAGALDRFIVTNAEDRVLLNQIRKSAGCQQDCGVFQVKASPRYHVPPPPVDGVETVCTVLNIPDDLVFNCLVDQNRIDQKALARSKEDGESKLLYRKHGGDYAIRGNINEVYSLPTGDRWIVKGGVLSMISNDKRPRSTIGVDKTAAIAHAERELFQVESELKEFRSAEARLEGEHTKSQRQCSRTTKS